MQVKIIDDGRSKFHLCPTGKEMQILEIANEQPLSEEEDYEEPSPRKRKTDNWN